MELPAYSGENGQCPKCEATEARTDWFPQDALHELANVPQNVLEINILQDLLRRECTRCCYAWHEVPLDAPGVVRPETPVPTSAEEVRALRTLIAALWDEIPEDVITGEAFSPNVRQAAQMIVREWHTDNAPDEAASDPVRVVRSAAPYFAPLRPDNG